jgi:hypothetical protein
MLTAAVAVVQEQAAVERLALAAVALYALAVVA